MGNGEEICGLPLEATYGVEKGRAIKAKTEDMNTMLALPEAFSNGYASWLKWNDSKFSPSLLSSLWLMELCFCWSFFGVLLFRELEGFS